MIFPTIKKITTTFNSDDNWKWDDIMKLNIEAISAPRGFVFLWCGSTAGLDYGRQCLQKWGFRRCEDICWIKTNHKRGGLKTRENVLTFILVRQKPLEPTGIFNRLKEHCLMGIKGIIRRATDGDFIHANIDIDLLIDEEREVGNDEKVSFSINTT